MDFKPRPSTLSRAARDGQGRLALFVRFLGLLGPQGALPLAITEEAYGWSLAGDDAFPRFLDVFNNRFLQLFYRAWADARPIAQHERPEDDRFAAFRICLEGGDPVRGRRLFSERADWGCQRCHKLSGDGGDVGPELTTVGKTRGREAVLQSILYPNDTIAPGFENLIVTRRDGTLVVGVLKVERPDALELQTPEDGRVVIPTKDITSRERGLSAMPEGLGDLMTRSELRDLIEALSQ